MKPGGLPHSEIPGSASQQLPEAYRSVATSFIGPRRQGIHPALLEDCVTHSRASARGPAFGRAAGGGHTRGRSGVTGGSGGGDQPGEAWLPSHHRHGPRAGRSARGRRGSQASRVGDTVPAGTISDVDKVCGWKGTPPGREGRDGSGEPPVAACVYRRGPEVPRTDCGRNLP